MRRILLLTVSAITLIALVSLLIVAEQPKEADAKKEFEKFQGRWTTVSRVDDGKASTEEDTKNHVITIKGDLLTVLNKDTEVATGRLKLDPSKNPTEYELIYASGPNKGKARKGIYKFEGDLLTTCLAGVAKSHQRSSQASLVQERLSSFKSATSADVPNPALHLPGRHPGFARHQGVAGGPARELGCSARSERS
jgi:uncharacterized protein (TIGR03067 family)